MSHKCSVCNEISEFVLEFLNCKINKLNVVIFLCENCKNKTTNKTTNKCKRCNCDSVADLCFKCFKDYRICKKCYNIKYIISFYSLVLTKSDVVDIQCIICRDSNMKITKDPFYTKINNKFKW